MSAGTRGRTPVDIDLVQLEKLCGFGCTQKELAGFFGVTERTIELRRQRSEAFRDAMDRGASRVNVALRRKQVEMALDGDRTMLIWLGKQRLNQKDRIETEDVSDAGPVKINVNFVEAPKAA